MNNIEDFFEDHYLFTVRNMCGEYTVWLGDSCEREKLSYVVKLGGEPDRELGKKNESDQKKALPYLQEICDKAFNENENLFTLMDKLEKFGNPHYSPIPWEQSPLPKGAIE